MHCHKGTSNLVMKVSEITFDSSSFWEPDETGKVLTVNCTTDDQLVYEIAPTVNATGFIGLIYNNCPVPSDGRSLSLGFSNLHRFHFTSERTDDIGALTRENFDGLGFLIELRLLASSGAFNLADDAFADLSRLKKLYLHSNHINFKVFTPLKSVEKIEIGFHKGEFNLDGFANCEKLEQINLANLDVARLSKRIFQNLPVAVETIFFYDNNIDVIDPDVFESVRKLNFVRFYDNTINHFPSHFAVSSDNFRYFQLTGDHQSLPDELLSNLPELRDVDIHCNLKSVPENLFKGSYNLNIANFTGNQLTNLPENLFANQTALFHLYLDQNRFDNILPDNLITNLMTKPQWVSSVSFIFSFNSNRIQSISEHDMDLLLENRAEYGFSNNLISDLSVFNNLKEKLYRYGGVFDFNGNPIDCACDKIRTFQKFLHNSGTLQNYYYNSNGLKCVSPANLAGTSLIDVRCE